MDTQVYEYHCPSCRRHFASVNSYRKHFKSHYHEASVKPGDDPYPLPAIILGSSNSGLGRVPTRPEKPYSGSGKTTERNQQPEKKAEVEDDNYGLNMSDHDSDNDSKSQGSVGSTKRNVIVLDKVPGSDPQKDNPSRGGFNNPFGQSSAIPLGSYTASFMSKSEKEDKEKSETDHFNKVDIILKGQLKTMRDMKNSLHSMGHIFPLQAKAVAERERGEIEISRKRNIAEIDAIQQEIQSLSNKLPKLQRDLEMNRLPIKLPPPEKGHSSKKHESLKDKLYKQIAPGKKAQYERNSNTQEGKQILSEATKEIEDEDEYGDAKSETSNAVSSILQKSGTEQVKQEIKEECVCMSDTYIKPEKEEVWQMCGNVKIPGDRHALHTCKRCGKEKLVKALYETFRSTQYGRIKIVDVCFYCK